MPMLTQQRETQSCVAALETCAPNAVTACRDWTAHDLAAHLAGNSAEIARVVEAYADGREVPKPSPETCARRASASWTAPGCGASSTRRRGWTACSRQRGALDAGAQQLG